MRWSCLSPSRCGFNAFLPCYQVMLQLSVVWLLLFCLFCLQSTINCILFSTMTPWCRRRVSICSVSYSCLLPVLLFFCLSTSMLGNVLCSSPPFSSYGVQCNILSPSVHRDPGCMSCTKCFEIQYIIPSCSFFPRFTLLLALERCLLISSYQ